MLSLSSPSRTRKGRWHPSHRHGTRLAAREILVMSEMLPLSSLDFRKQPRFQGVQHKGWQCAWRTRVWKPSAAVIPLAGSARWSRRGCVCRWMSKHATFTDWWWWKYLGTAAYPWGDHDFWVTMSVFAFREYWVQLPGHQWVWDHETEAQVLSGLSLHEMPQSGDAKRR